MGTQILTGNFGLVASLLLAVLSVSLIEAIVVSRGLHWNTFKKSFGFAALANIGGLIPSGVLLGLAAFVFLIGVYIRLGSSEEESVSGLVQGVALVIICLIPLALILWRRTLAWLLGMANGSRTWAYAIVAGLVYLVLSLALSVVFYYFYNIVRLVISRSI